MNMSINFNPLSAMLPTYRNQSIDLLCKLVDWFLYEGNTGTKWVNMQTHWSWFKHQDLCHTNAENTNHYLLLTMTKRLFVTNNRCT